jgi:hypothetical protein
MLQENTSFDPDEIKILTGAYEDAILILRLSEEERPTRELLAAKILDIATAGERDRASLCNVAIAAVRLHKNNG